MAAPGQPVSCPQPAAASRTSLAPVLTTPRSGSSAAPQAPAAGSERHGDEKADGSRELSSVVVVGHEDEGRQSGSGGGDDGAGKV